MRFLLLTNDTPWNNELNKLHAKPSQNYVFDL